MFRRLSRQQHLDFETHALVHLDALMRAAVRLCDSREAAEDALQETYLQAWKYWRTFQPGTNCRAWLFRILFNVIKKRSGEKNADVPLEESDFENVLRFEPAGQIEEYEVLEAFDRLAEDQRAVLLLVVVEEMSYKEAAITLGVPVGTVMSRLSRARTELRRMLGRAHPRSFIKAVGTKH
ncbi:MAG: RNA polymerase sigma factor [Acidobacteria bacterium]|nr:RNA polymerase sigma factor [Acidobacteriota bacterium]